MMFSYTHSPSTGFVPVRADALDNHAQLSNLDEDENPVVVPRRAVTLDELAAEKRMLGAAKNTRGTNRRAFGDLSNSGISSRGGKRTGEHRSISGSARSVAASDASTLQMQMDWSTLSKDEISAIQAQRRRNANNGSRACGLTDEVSPRTPNVESPADSCVTRDTDDTVPPGALTIQRANYAARHFDDMEMEHMRQQGYSTHHGSYQHQHHMTYETNLRKLLLWRDTSRSAFVFLSGIIGLTMCRAPGFILSRVPVNPVVVLSYVCMAYVSRANLLATVFSNRKHGFGINVEYAKQFAETFAMGINKITDAHDDVLSGRDNLKVLTLFTSLYLIVQLGKYLNSTWWTLFTLWCGAFSVFKFGEWRSEWIGIAKDFLRREILSRFYNQPAERRWAVGVVTAGVSFYVSSFEFRIVLGFASFVALRFWRESSIANAKRFDAAMRSASRRLSRAGSEFQQLVNHTPSFLIRKRR